MNWNAVVLAVVGGCGRGVLSLAGPGLVDAAAKAFRIYHGKGTVEDGGAYLVDHSNIVYLFGPDGAPIATLPADQGAEAVARELDRWVR